MKTRLPLLLSTLTISLLLSSDKVAAVAYCALRDPVSAIQHFYPDYSTYKSMDGTVDETVRALLSQRLPNIHFSEFGTHTLYAVYSNEVLTGYVHARTEKGEWGLDELIWALTPELRIKEFRYQRSRSSGRQVIESDQFQAWLSGRSVDDFVGLIDVSGEQLRERPDFLAPEFEELALTVIQSAIKTLVITEHVWHGDP